MLLLLTKSNDSLHFPALTSVTGNVILQSVNCSDCKQFRQLAAAGTIKGIVFCSGSSSNVRAVTPVSPPPPTASSTITPAGIKQHDGSLSGGAIAGTAVAAVVGWFAIIGTLAIILVRRRRKRALEAAVEKDRNSQSSVLMVQKLPRELSSNNIHELAGDSRYRPAELRTTISPELSPGGPSDS